MRYLVLLVALLGTVCPAQAEPQRLSVLTEVQFNGTGEVEQLRFVQSGDYSEAFMVGLRERVLRIRIPPPRLHDQPARLRSGLVLKVEIEQVDGRGQVRLAGMQLQPLVLKAEIAVPPDAHADFDRVYVAHCLISAEGLCEVERIEAENGPLEDAMRRWVHATMKLWRFQPPTLNGQPIAASVQVPLRLLTLPEEAYAPPDFRLGTRLSGAPNAWR